MGGLRLVTGLNWVPLNLGVRSLRCGVTPGSAYLDILKSVSHSTSTCHQEKQHLSEKLHSLRTRQHICGKEE